MATRNTARAMMAFVRFFYMMVFLSQNICGHTTDKWIIPPFAAVCKGQKNKIDSAIKSCAI